MNSEPFYQNQDWARKMRDFAPHAFNYYTNLENEILKDQALSKKDKLLILVGINAAGRYERGVMDYTKKALDAGASLGELVEILTPCILSRGIPAWFEGLKAITFALEIVGRDENSSSYQEFLDFQDVHEVINYFKTEANGIKAEWVTVMEQEAEQVLYHYGNLRASILKDGAVSRKLKEFVLVGINVAERYPKGIELHLNSARKLGATEAEISEVVLTGMLNGGLPAWFEGSVFLK
jgi:alkylhydroperoxidase/carboxymuconolactone decarboxylase family protein YurZ